jgi:hypothetical protein
MNPATSIVASSVTAITTAVSSFLTSFTLETIASTDTSTVSPTTPGPENHDHHKKHYCLSEGGLVAIIFVLIAFLAISVFCWWWKRRSRKNRENYDRSQENIRKRTPTRESSDDECVRASDPLPEQRTRPETTQAMNHSEHHQVPQMFQPYTPPHSDANQSHDLPRTPDQVATAQPRQRTQALTPHGKPIILPPATEKDVHDFLNSASARASTPRPPSDRRGRSPPPPVPPPATAPPALFSSPNTENGNGSPTPYLPPGHGNLKVANGPASNRSSGTSKLGPASSTGRGSNTSGCSVPLGLDPNLLPTSYKKSQASSAHVGG